MIAKTGINVVGFQFYDSPIKSIVWMMYKTDIREFQFYDSPIKRTRRCGTCPNLLSFNSMIVRLKVVLCLVSPSPVVFQFYDSPIKRSSRNEIAVYSPNFNSMIVRLKEQEANINSGMVNEFQFYDSPIKRPTLRQWLRSKNLISIL